MNIKSWLCVGKLNIQNTLHDKLPSLGQRQIKMHIIDSDIHNDVTKTTKKPPKI